MLCQHTEESDHTGCAFCWSVSKCNATSKARIPHCRHFLSCGRKFLCSHHVQNWSKNSNPPHLLLSLVSWRSIRHHWRSLLTLLCSAATPAVVVFFLSNHFFLCFSFHLFLYSSTRSCRRLPRFLDPFHLFCLTVWTFLFFPWDYPRDFPWSCFWSAMFFLREFPFPLPLWILSLSTPFPEPTFEAKSSAAFTISLKPSLLSVLTPCWSHFALPWWPFLQLRIKDFQAFHPRVFWTTLPFSSGHRLFSCPRRQLFDAPCLSFSVRFPVHDIPLLSGQLLGVPRPPSPSPAVLAVWTWGSQHHYRSLSRVDEETTAHNEWVLLRCLGWQGFPYWQCTQNERAGLRHRRFELMWTPRGRAECFLESRSMEKCAQSMLLLLNLPALFTLGNLDIISTNTS